MLRLRAVVLFALAGACTATASQGAVPGEVLVKYHDDNVFTRAAGARRTGGVILQTLPGIGVHRLALPRGMSVARAVQNLKSLWCVEFAEPNYLFEATDVPNDTLYPEQWSLQKIDCERGWDLTHGGPEIVIAVLDTGTDFNHPDIGGKLNLGWDFQNGDPDPSDDNGHGTHVAGIAAAATNNSLGIAGVGYTCRIMSIKVLDENGRGSASTAATGISWAADQGARIISMSFGSTSNSSTLRAAVAYAASRGALMIAAAGNSGNTIPNYPANYSQVIAVAASDPSDDRASFSTFGAWVDVAAPGTAILSTFPQGQYRVLSGTSMAAPHVSGLAALLLAAMGPDASADDIRRRIENNVIPVGTWVAQGRIDVYRSLYNLGKAEPVRRSSAPTSFGVDQGILRGGGLASLAASEDDRLNISSRRSQGRQRVEFWAGFQPDFRGSMLGLELLLEVGTQPAGSVKVYFYSFQDGGWVLAGSKSSSLIDRTQVFATSTPEKFIGLDGEFLVHIVRTEASGRLFSVRTDQILVTSISSE